MNVLHRHVLATAVTAAFDPAYLKIHQTNYRQAVTATQISLPPKPNLTESYAKVVITVTLWQECCPII
jgi:hypothetical protein